MTVPDGGHHTDRAESTAEQDPIESTIQQQLQLIDRRCFDENLDEYLQRNPVITLGAEDIKIAVKNLIKGIVIEPEILNFLREHASEFYTQTKQKARYAVIPAGMGVTDWANIHRDSVRGVFGKIDSIIGVGAKLEEKVPGKFNLMERATVRAQQLEELGMMLELTPEDAKAMGNELMELVRKASLPYTQDYGKLKKLATDMTNIGTTSMGVDFSHILAKYWHPSIEELQELLEHDFKTSRHEKKEAIKNAALNKDSERYRTILLLAALRKTLGTEDVMAPVNSYGILDKIQRSMFMQRRPDETVFFYNIEDGLEEKKRDSTMPRDTHDVRLHMQSLSQWLSITFARLMNNQKLEPDKRTLHDSMTTGTSYMKQGDQAPNFDNRRIVGL